MGKLTESFEKALESAPIREEDGAAVELGRRYAELLDDQPMSPELANELGPKYLAVLTALGMTPAGRGKEKGGVGDGVSPQAAALARLRDDFRAHRTPDLHTTAA